ncbi:MAG: leucine-rich repeat domain-containing protein [Clostridiales bacterium]|nr:leucine-rich repeat domain-containing protein [Clostridiales bacterium]
MNDFMYPSFAYEKKEDGAVILRCFSRDGIVRIPERIDGLPVRELGAYAFSAHMDPAALSGVRYACDTADAGEDSQRDADHLSDLDALCGDRLEEITLPQTITRVGRYCFYNCGHLRRLEFSGSLKDWESGVFTGCHRVRELCVHADPEEETGLKQVLDELPEELCVEFYYQNKQAVLTFPEFYEEGVENTPARILETHVHGTGIRYRNCFQGKRFDFTLYDSLFPYARAQEDSRLLAELVLGRLRFPYHLGEPEQNHYDTYVRENVRSFGCYFLDQKDPGGLQWFLERFAACRASRPASFAETMMRPDAQPGESDSLLDFLSGYAARHGDALSQSRLMEFRHRNEAKPARRRKLEL